jgi:hypothetical protein
VKYRKNLISGTICQPSKRSGRNVNIKVNVTSKLQMDGCKTSENRHSTIKLCIFKGKNWWYITT